MADLNYSRMKGTLELLPHGKTEAGSEMVEGSLQVQETFFPRSWLLSDQLLTIQHFCSLAPLSLKNGLHITILKNHSGYSLVPLETVYKMVTQ